MFPRLSDQGCTISHSSQRFSVSIFPSGTAHTSRTYCAHYPYILPLCSLLFSYLLLSTIVSSSQALHHAQLRPIPRTRTSRRLGSHLFHQYPCPRSRSSSHHRILPRHPTTRIAMIAPDTAFFPLGAACKALYFYVNVHIFFGTPQGCTGLSPIVLISQRAQRLPCLSA